MKKFLFIYLLVAACTYDTYETGDGAYSNLHADYCDAAVEGGTVTTLITDDGVVLKAPADMKYAAKSDTVLRRLVYYNKQAEDAAVEILSFQTVYMLLPLEKDEKTASLPTDPLTLTAAWLSGNKKYINVHVGIKTGSTDDEAAQSLLLRLDEVNERGGGCAVLTLCHSQGDVPEYYTRDVHFSVPVERLPAVDTLRININTYSGAVQRMILLR